MRTAASAAAVTMKPSTSTGRRACAAAMQAPASAAISKPPRQRRRSKGSSASACRRRARSITAILRAMPASSRPVPAPASAIGDASSSAHANAVADVVLAMPISPPMNRSAPAERACATRSAPMRIAASHCSRVIAGARQRLAVDGAMIARSTPSIWPGSLTVPRFTTSSVASSMRASTLIAAPPPAKLRTISPVTACGNADTPSSATPWSAANTLIHTRSIFGDALPCHAASCSASDSSRPSDPGGLVRVCCRACAASAACRSSVAAGLVHQYVFMAMLRRVNP